MLTVVPRSNPSETPFAVPRSSPEIQADLAWQRCPKGSSHHNSRRNRSRQSFPDERLHSRRASRRGSVRRPPYSYLILVRPARSGGKPLKTRESRALANVPNRLLRFPRDRDRTPICCHGMGPRRADYRVLRFSLYEDGTTPGAVLHHLSCHSARHQKGIIHRDIKPTNVLVADVDDHPVVKVIDFGLAKATEARLTEKSIFTQLRQMVGTPAYMSPEQAEAEKDIDTRSDVFSLGVLLYELLTGVTPLDTTTLYSAGYAEIQRMIREYDPPRMSHRLSSLGDESTIAAGNRSTDSRRLAQIVRGDLDLIAMKALEKDRARRYETPSGFAQDIQRYLRREAIEARPASTIYRVQKFLARNRVAVGTTAFVAVALVIGTMVSTWQAIRANQAAAAEREANEQAQKRLTQVERGTEVLGAIFQDIDLRRIEGEARRLSKSWENG